MNFSKALQTLTYIHKPILGLIGIAAIACLGFFGMRSLPVQAQVSSNPTTASEVGRYNLAISQSFVYFIDTKTGRIWWQPSGNRNTDESDMTWTAIASPVAPLPKQ